MQSPQLREWLCLLIGWHHYGTHLSKGRGRYFPLICSSAICQVHGIGAWELGKLAQGILRYLLYQIRRPLGLVFVISFVGWENCCHSLFRWTLICPSLSQSPDLLVFPATYTPPHTLIVDPHLNLNHGRVSLTKLTWLWYFPKTSNTQLSPSRTHSFLWLPISLNKRYCDKT